MALDSANVHHRRQFFAAHPKLIRRDLRDACTPLRIGHLHYVEWKASEAYSWIFAVFAGLI
jgi:hypothetical protein